MSDLIDRQAALEAIRNCTDIFVNNLPTMIDKVDAQEALMALPSAEPKKGCWLDALDEDPCYYRCSECGRLSGFSENFCPSCGADMRGEEE